MQIFIIILSIVIAYTLFSPIYFKLNGYYPIQHIVYLKWNLSKQSEFETENFIINIPKFTWVATPLDDGSIYFSGVDICWDGLDCSNISTPTIEFRKILEKEVEIWKNTICDKLFSKSIEKIDNLETDVYVCEGSKIKYSFSKFFIYKNEGFYIYAYDNKVQSQYEKFFQGVKLKQ